MQYAITGMALVAAVAALPQASTSGDCAASYPGTFQIQVVNQTTTNGKRDVMPFEKRQSHPLELTLENGVLHDNMGRIADIVSNYQFQFDPPPGQAGYIYNSGWAVCSNGSLAIQGDTTFYQCLSGTFYNLYDKNIAAQCSPVYIQVINDSQGSSASMSMAPSAVSQMADGQITGVAVSQIADGQIQQATGAPVQQISDGQIQQQTGAAVQQISDGQIQKPTASPVQQISDGQIQQPTGAPVQQISDGQIQQPTGSPVQQISDGQIQKPTGSPVQQISDGQIQQPTGAAVSQIADGQIQASNNSAAATQPAAYTGAATVVRTSAFGLAAGVLALALL